MHEFEDTTSEQRDMAIFQELCNREEIDLEVLLATAPPKLG